ncbi:Uncharacterized protein conserved in bacteria [Serratia plymuthica]|nr:Uncharacterized protein conserved in bacteria [Serratia plymuthica]VEI21431.1 Uncharacterized protein conserved in bacteria [Serratia plymuthica]
MDMLSISYEFICSHIKFSWFDIKWGYEKKLIGWYSIVKHAEYLVSLGEASQLELELSFKSKMDTHEIKLILDDLSMCCANSDESVTQEKWLFIILLWLFANRNNYSEPLKMVEAIYEDFDYPEAIESFVSYMPVSDGYDPSVHSHRENTERLFRNWQTYLDQESVKFKQ